MAVIVALLMGLFPATASALQDDPPEAAGSAESAETGSGASGPLGLDVDLNGWTVQDLMNGMDQNRLAVLAVATFLVLLFLWTADVLRPGGLSKNGRDVKSHPATVWMFAGLMVLAAAAFSGAILSQQAWLTGPDPESLRALSAVAAATYGVSAAVALGLIYLFARSAPKAGLVPGVMDVPFGLLCLALAAPVVLLSAELAVLIYERAMETTVEPIAHPQLDLMIANRSDPWVWGLILAAAVGAPIVEEAIFRVFFQSAILKWTGSAWAAVVGAAGLFTAVHAFGPGAVPPYALAPIAVLGLSMGIAYERTRRIGVPIVMHMGFNAANILLAMETQG
jgi:membrane protease YdiL (CAAX protease family)